MIGVTKMKYAKAAALVLTASSLAASAAPRGDDYAQGLEVTVYETRPLVELVLPDEVYRNVVRADLGDVRVFNAEGAPVPHAFCAAAPTAAPEVTREALPMFDLQAAAPGATASTQIDVATAGGAQLRINEGTVPPPAAETLQTKTWAHVIDARGVTDALRSMEFDWLSPDGASQARVSVEASDDLDRWHTVVADSTLLRVTRDGQELQRKVVPLPMQRYRFLRVVRIDGGPALQIAQVVAERVAPPQAIEPTWFTANPQPSNAAGRLQFDAARLAPVGYARLLLPQENSSVRVRIRSRPDEQAAWRERWSGEVYSIVNDGERRTSPPAEFDGEHDRYWQVIYTEAAQALEPAPKLELGYRPTRLRFLAQGKGPWTLAFGSRRAEPVTAQSCNGLLSDIGADRLDELVAEGVPGAAHVLGGAIALKPLPKPTPVRLVVLWAVLIAGAGGLIVMALSLLKRVHSR